MRHQEHRNIATCRSMDRRLALDRNPTIQGRMEEAILLASLFCASSFLCTRSQSLKASETVPVRSLACAKWLEPAGHSRSTRPKELGSRWRL